MGFTESLGMMVGGGLVGKAMGMFGPSQSTRDHRQIEQQKKLSQIQEEANRRLMQDSYGLQKDMYNHQYGMNTPEAMRKRYEEAGMNPALAYTQGGVGGVSGGSGGASVGGGMAANAAQDMTAEASKEGAMNQKIGMALQHRMQESQIALNESQAAKNEKEAENLGAKTTTEEQQRDILIDNLKKINQGMFIEQMEKRFEQGHNFEDGKGQGISGENEITGYTHTILKDSLYGEKVVTEVLKTQAETGNIEAQELLTNKKAEGYFKELLIKQQEADQEGMKSAAMKLAAEWSTGEFKNWKTWYDMGTTSGKLLLEAFKAGVGAKKGGK